MIYLDNAATTKVSPRVKQAMLPYFDEIYANPSSLHDLGQAAKVALEDARAQVAACLGAKPREIYFTSGGSESNNFAIHSACAWGKQHGKNHIITTAFEHHSVLDTLKQKEQQGFRVTYLPVYENGIIKVADLVQAIEDDTFLVSIMFANNEIGTLQPIAEIGALCRERGIIFHTDAVQAVGHVPVDVAAQKIDLLSLSAHKFHGPKGVGVLYYRENLPLTKLVYGGAQERGKRAGTENLPGIVGLATALSEATEHMAAEAVRQTKLRDQLFGELSKISDAQINGDRTHRLPGNFNMSFAGVEGESLLLKLNAAGICGSSGSACTSGSLDPSHVLLALGLSPALAQGSLRLTLSRYTTEQEIDEVIAKIPPLIASLRERSV